MWQRLLTTYGPQVYHWCERTGLNAAGSSDVMQNVFVTFSKSVHKFEKDRESDSFCGWMWTITQNNSQTHFSKHFRTREPNLMTVLRPPISLPDTRISQKYSWKCSSDCSGN